jgi:hypothetical protein
MSYKIVSYALMKHINNDSQINVPLPAFQTPERKPRSLTRSSVAYQCFATGLDHYLQGKPNPRTSNSDDWDNRPKRDAKLVGIYLSETDCKKLIKLDSIIERRFWGAFSRRGEERRPFQFRKPTALAYACFRGGLALMLATGIPNPLRSRG